MQNIWFQVFCKGQRLTIWWDYPRREESQMNWRNVSRTSSLFCCEKVSITLLPSSQLCLGHPDTFQIYLIFYDLLFLCGTVICQQCFWSCNQERELQQRLCHLKSVHYYCSLLILCYTCEKWHICTGEGDWTSFHCT